MLRARIDNDSATCALPNAHSPIRNIVERKESRSCYTLESPVERLEAPKWVDRSLWVGIDIDRLPDTEMVRIEPETVVLAQWLV